MSNGGINTDNKVRGFNQYRRISKIAHLIREISLTEYTIPFFGIVFKTK